jgi:diacylglycerol kinase (ATP)
MAPYRPTPAIGGRIVAGMKRIAVLINPGAGGGRSLALGRRVVDILGGRGQRPQVLLGSDGPEAARLLSSAAAAGLDTLVVCGGDGTINAALQVVAGSGTSLGVIPCGSGNDLARSWGLPVASPARALSVVLAGHLRTVDLARAGDRWFGAVLATGFDAKVNERGNALSWPGGRWRYDVATLVELTSFRPLSYRLLLDGRALELDAMLVAVGNGPSYGGGMRICPGASLVDGLLDVTVVSRISRAKLVRLFPAVYSGRHVRRPEVLTFRARSVTVEAIGVNGYADGEFVCPLPLDVVAVPGALRVFTPAG